MILLHHLDGEMFSPPTKTVLLEKSNDGKLDRTGLLESPLTPTSRSLKGATLEDSETASHETTPSSVVDDNCPNGSMQTLPNSKLGKDTDLDYTTMVESANRANNEGVATAPADENVESVHSVLSEHPKCLTSTVVNPTESPKQNTENIELQPSQHDPRASALFKETRRHTSPIPVPISRLSMDMIHSRRSLDRGGRYQSQSVSQATIRHLTFRTSSTFDRAGSSIDLQNLRKQSSQDPASSEISRMRTSIIVKRNIQKRQREFLEDDNLIGNKISEGHENFVMAYNMLTGIRVAVSRCSGVMKKLNDADFKATKKLTFNMDGSELTPSSKYDFKFKDYCPEVFRELRSLFGIDPADYLISITGKYILSQLGSPGKSGSFFYYSRDFRFIIKTIHHAEHKQLRRILKDYYQHVKSNPNTLISQFYGLHRLKVQGGMKKVHFIVMNNLFPPHRDIHRKYDLKGSTWGRYTNLAANEDLSHVTLKDLNFLERHDKIKFGPDKRKIFLEQLEADIRLLKKINVMDYSLLLGVHDVNKGNAEKPANLSLFDPKSNVKSDVINTNPRDIDRVDLPKGVFPGRSKYIFYGHDGGIRATNENNEPMPEIYYLGIIDCLTNYSIKKRLETFWRSLNHTRSTISALPASEYGDRFLKFIKDGLSSEKIKRN